MFVSDHKQLSENGFQRRKSKRSKIHRLLQRFFINFSLLGLGFGFLSKTPRFLFGNQPIINI
jgi:hypothetical protein